MALLDRITDERVLGLQVQDVELVDARRHQQKRALVHLGGERLVFDQLEIVVLEHHRTFGGRNVFADLKHALIGHRQMALADVVQEVGHAFGDALALGVDGFLLGFGVERQKVARCARVDPLLNGESHTGAGFGVPLHRFGQGHQGAGVEQIRRCRKRRHGVLLPSFCGEAAITHRLGIEPLHPQLARLFHVRSLHD